ncbi:hypothetical protein [Bradyrhizobium jicamae]|uniref:hypothetical protein n=1 Tax=Bradyrhizobium jicamae TaxID=280332 RepID=UPI0039080027
MARIVVMMLVVVMLVVMIVVVMIMMIVAVILMPMIFMPMIMRLMGMTFVGRHLVIVVRGIERMLERLMRLSLRVDCPLDHLALYAVAMAAAAGIAMARPAAMAAILMLFLGLAMRALISLDQGLTVGDRNLVVVGMDFAEGQEAVPVSAIFDEGGLQRRLYARDLGEIDIAAQLLALGGLEIKLFDAIATDHDDPGLFRVGGIDQHLVGHFGALEGGGRGAWRAQIAPPGDATVHLIRG